MTTPAQILLEDPMPIGLLDFDDIIDNKLLYIDKTDLVAQIAKKRGIVFLSRPRRFGKTFLVSTFYELFARGTKRFKGLKLVRDNLWNDYTYKVIRLMLNLTCEFNKTKNYKQVFGSHLSFALKSVGIEVDRTVEWDVALTSALQSIENDSLVLLMDTYSDPLTHALNDNEEFEQRLMVLNQFFNLLKTNISKFRFIFITGVYRFSNLNLFSDPSNFVDLSFDPMYGSLTGITQDELETYFGGYIDNAALVLKQQEPDKNWDRQKVLDEIKYYYGGYCFDRNAKTQLYNPFSVMKFFSNPSEGFKLYWQRRGAPTPPIVVYCLNNLEEQKKGLGELADFLKPNPVIAGSEQELTPSINNPNPTDANFPFFAILCHMGYFTIKSAKGNKLYLGIPNPEIKEAFVHNIVEHLAKTVGFRARRNTYVNQLYTALCNKDFPALKNELNYIIEEFCYQNILPFSEEKFRDILKLVMHILGLECSAEEEHTKGCCDLCIHIKDYLLVFEITVVADRSKADEAFETAKKELIDRKYAVSASQKQLVAAGMVIVNEKQLDYKEDPICLREIVKLEEITV